MVQHPTTGGVTGSYNIVSGTTNKLQFTTAPASGVDIQIRHLGFAGASSGDVSGFYGRTGNVGLNADDHITTGDITSRNINASGIVTAASFSGAITGNVTGNATGLTGNPSISITDLNVDGHTNLDNVSIAGVTTITSSTYPLNVHADTAYQGILVNGNNAPTVGFNIGNNATPSWKLGLSGVSHTMFAISQGAGNSDVLRIDTSGETRLFGSLITTQVTIGSNLIHDGDTDTMLSFVPSGDIIDLKTGGSTRLRAENSGVDITGDLDVDGHTNLDNVSIAGVATVAGNLHVGGVLTYEDVTNVDSVGLITARKGIISSGVVTATSFSGDGSNLTGVVQSDRPAGGSSESEIFFEVDTGVSISTTTTLSRASSNPGRIFTKVKEIVVGTSSPSSVELIVAANEQLVVDYFDVIT